MSRWRSFITFPVLACLAASGLAATGLVVTQAIGIPATPARAASGCFPAGGRQVPSAPAPASASTDLIVQGHGWGHGLGMSQYGAQGAALLGCNHAQILRTYYAGTHLRRQRMTAPVVLSLRSGARTTVTAESGKVVWTTPAGTRRVQPRGQTWTAQAVNRHGIPGTGLLDAGRKLQMWVSTGSLAVSHSAITVRLRTFGAASSKPSMDKRLSWGITRFTRRGGGLTVEETIPTDKRGTSVDKYLWGLGEVPVSWPVEALRAQADAARTYLTGSFTAGAYRIGTTTAAQVYTGATRENQDIRYGSRWRAASVNATSGEVVVDSRGAPITAMYSSSDGGRSESRGYVYGAQGGFGYLTSVDDSRWDLASSNPHRSWAKAITPADFAAALGFSSVTRVSLAAPGTAARQAGLQVTGVIGGVSRTVSFTGAAARSALGLRSPAFTISWARPAPTGPTALEVQPLTGDWDGDGKDEFGVFRGGQVSLRMADGTLTRYPLGRAGDIAVVGDWDGDGKDSVGVFRAGTWKLRNALGAGPFDQTFSFGAAGDQPVTGHWACRGHLGIGVVRGARWYLRTTVSPGPAELKFGYGVATDRALAGDWNGNGCDTPGVFRSGTFYLQPWLGAGIPHVVRIGHTSDAPAVGDFDGVGGDTTGVHRGETFYYRNDLLGGVGTGTVALAG